MGVIADALREAYSKPKIRVNEKEGFFIDENGKRRDLKTGYFIVAENINFKINASIRPTLKS